MRTYMLAGYYELHENDKRGFIEHVASATEAAVEPNMWARFHPVEADETQSHVLISRKVNLTGTEQMVTLSIDLVHQDDRWQITREVIFAISGT